MVDLCLFDFGRQRRGLPKMDRHGGGHSSLSVADVAALLDELGMKQYVPTFEEFAIDGLALVECEDADLIECGMNHKPVRQRSLGCCCCRCRCRCCSHLLRARRTSQVETVVLPMPPMPQNLSVNVAVIETPLLKYI